MRPGEPTLAVGAALPDVPAGALRRALRDQPVDAPRGDGRPRPSRAAVGSARRQPARRRRRGRHDRAADRTCPTSSSPPTPGIVSRRRRSCRATSAIPNASRRPRCSRRGSPSTGGRSTACPPSSATKARATRLPFAGTSAVAATGTGPTRRPAPSCPGMLGAPVRTRRAGRRAAVPRRPHVLSARRPPRAVRADGLGPLRPQGRRGARARTALARRRRGAVVLRELGRGRHERRDAGRAAARRPPARGVGLRRRRVSRSASS